MVDNLNAELSLGTITNVDEAVTWLSYTYLYVRMRKNPLVYGMDHTEPAEDPLLGKKRRDIIIAAAKNLHKAQMIIYDENTGYLTPKDLGRIASNYYVSYNSVNTYNSLMKPRMTEADVLAMVSRSTEFENVKSRDNEHSELAKLLEQACPCDVKVISRTTATANTQTHQSILRSTNMMPCICFKVTLFICQGAITHLSILFLIRMS